MQYGCSYGRKIEGESMKGILKHDIEAGILLEYKRFLIGFLLFTVLAICAVLKANMSSISWIECLAIMNKGGVTFYKYEK